MDLLMFGSAMDTMNVRKTSDIRKACNNCIKAKAACDNNRPCFRCLSHKLADSCANVARKHNVAKRKRVGEDMDEHDPNNPTAPGDLQYNLSYMINNSLNNIINNLNNGSNNMTYSMPQVEGEVNGQSMVSSVINTAIQNLNSKNTSAIISNTISNLNNYNPINQAVNNISIETPPPPAATAVRSIASQEVDYESVLQWLQSAATNVPAPLAPVPPSQHNRGTFNNPNTGTPNQNSILNRSSPQVYSPQLQSLPHPHQEDHIPPPLEYNSYSFAPPQQPRPMHTSSQNIQQQQQQQQQIAQYNQPLPSPAQHSGQSPSQPTNHSPSQVQMQTPSPQQQQQQTPPQYSTPQSPSPYPSPSYGTPSDHSPDSPVLPEQPVNPDLPCLPTLNVTIYTRPNKNTAAAFSYVSNLLKHSPLGVSNSGTAAMQDPDLNAVHPHNISIPYCSAGSLVQTLSLLKQYSAIDMSSPIHIDYTYKSMPMKTQPVALIEMSGPKLVDCSDSFGQVLGFKDARELLAQNRPVSDYMLPEGIAISRRLKTSRIERYQVFLLRNRPARIFLTQHELVGSRHRTVTFLEEYPDFPICFFSDWIKTTLPNAILPPCPRPYCHCKYPDEYAKIG